MNGFSSALDGIRVIDLSRVLGGPYGTQVLGDYGADVIKVEPPSGDETRGWGPPFAEDAASYFHGLNRSKRGMALDLRQPEGKALLLEMLEGADVLVENFKPGTLEKWGLSYEVLKARFPGLIHCRVSGFGADGPLGGLPGYDAVIQAMSGLMSVNGESGGEPLRIGLPVVDIVTGLNAVIGITLALYERQRSGEGQFVEAALFDSGLSLMHPHFPNVFYGGPEPRRTGNAHPNIAPYEVYRTGTQPVFLAVGNHTQFVRLCEVLGCPGLSDDPRFVDNGARLGHRDALREALETAMQRLDGRELADRLIGAGVPCGPVLATQEVLAHPHTKHREMLIEIGAYKGTGSPIKLGRTPSRYERPPPRFAEHTDEILAELGLSPARVAELRARGVIPEVGG
ncbi:CaiB/BaiF CoA transferase family protein [Halomonas urumqiensis]|uniref:Carnitine dehydratase n=1 Tax=Halomonas urumqiensis TaxID=1684789 RepID=A0A2N7ULU9_9GAMM|nr:CaiB/BaiF CoA-transferase family protein [Halomonas urumqiensis]PMR81406.1 carnitine dehydratase [Halomonas urumqiensis]PTB01206.1 CoA transferase [Halomonas urumqiensis]GHE22783.1 CoA transferase [Halomonas urumqiensis]